MNRLARISINCFLAVLAVLLCDLSLSAQDTIVLRNNTSFECQVVEISKENVRYKKMDNLEGPDYVLGRWEVSRIIYKNGTKDIFEHIDSVKIVRVVDTIPLPLDYTNSGIWQAGKKLSPKVVKELMQFDSLALHSYKSGRSIRTVGSVISIPSAVALGWSLGRWIGGGEVNGTILGIGILGTVAGIGISTFGDADVKKSVRLFNESVKKRAGTSLELGLTNNGVGFCLQF